MMTDGRFANAKEVCHPFLGQPKSLAFKQNLDTHVSFRRGVQNDLVIRWRSIAA
jgi:hypothetical protein